MKLKNWIIAAPTIFMSLMPLISIVSGAHAISAEKKTFSFRLSAEPETLDWNKSNTIMASSLLLNMMDGLVRITSDLKIEPALAERWEISPDGKVYTFYLRPGVKWSDGVTLTAHDFVTSWKRLLSPKFAAPYASMLYEIHGAQDYSTGKETDFSKVGIQAQSNLVLSVKLRRPVASWIFIPSFWATFPLREDILNQFGESWSKPGRLTTLGPYTLSVYEFDSKIVLKANPNYYGKKGNIDEIVAYIVKDTNSALAQYESGKLDFLSEISGVDAGFLKARKDLKQYPFLKTTYLGFVVSKFPMSNIHFRKAVAMAIDKSNFRKKLGGVQNPATSFIPPLMLGHTDKLGLPFDLVQARKEMRMSGFDPIGSSEIELPVINFDTAIKVAQVVEAELETNLNLKIKLLPYDQKVYRNQLDLKIFGLFNSSWSADYPDPDNFLSIFNSVSGINRVQMKNSVFDQKLLDANGLQDFKQRERLYLDAQKILLEEQAAIVPLFYEPNLALIHDRVSGLEINPMNFLNLRNVSLK